MNAEKKATYVEMDNVLTFMEDFNVFVLLVTHKVEIRRAALVSIK